MNYGIPRYQKKTATKKKKKKSGRYHTPVDTCTGCTGCKECTGMHRMHTDAQGCRGMHPARHDVQALHAHPQKHPPQACPQPGPALAELLAFLVTKKSISPDIFRLPHVYPQNVGKCRPPRYGVAHTDWTANRTRNVNFPREGGKEGQR